MRLLLCLLLMACGGCAVLRPEGATPLPGGGYWKPLAPAQLGRSLSAVQRVTGEFGEHRAVLVFYLEVTGDHLALVGTTPDGTELFSLEQNGANIAVKSSPLLPPQLRPQAVLADLQMAFWPLDAVNRALMNTGLRATQQPAGIGSVRTIARANDIAIDIGYAAADPWIGSVAFDQRAWHYRYTVETLQWESIPPP